MGAQLSSARRSATGQPFLACVDFCKAHQAVPERPSARPRGGGRTETAKAWLSSASCAGISDPPAGSGSDTSMPCEEEEEKLKRYKKFCALAGCNAGRARDGRLFRGPCRLSGSNRVLRRLFRRQRACMHVSSAHSRLEWPRTGVLHIADMFAKPFVFPAGPSFLQAGKPVIRYGFYSSQYGLTFTRSPWRG